MQPQLSCQFHLCLTSAVLSRKDLFSGRVKSVQVCEQSCLSSAFQRVMQQAVMPLISLHILFLLWDVPICLSLSFLFCFLNLLSLFQAPSPFNAPCFTEQNISDFFFVRRDHQHCFKIISPTSYSFFLQIYSNSQLYFYHSATSPNHKAMA